jgi:glycosyltransferase involved in cell wall biosynthesis
MNTLYAVIPCYNEEEVLRETATLLSHKFEYWISEKIISDKSRIVFVNDGSKDSTWEIINKLHCENKLFSGINLSRNKGHQNALFAGLMTIKDKCDFTISLDADLQDSLEAMDEMIAKYKAGSDIVYGVRSSRKRDTVFKRTTAKMFYRLMAKLGVELVYNHADYRLMSSKALDALSKYNEVNLFLRGIVPLLGFPSAIVEYERSKRFAGKSKYPLRKMISFAIEGITSFSIQPIRLISGLGLLIFLFSIGMIIWFLIDYFNGNTVPGWASTVVSIWFVGGLQIFAIGVIGEYIGKVYLETKSRPRYIIQDILHED